MIMRSTLLVLGLVAILTGGILSMLATGPLALHSTLPEPAPLHHEVLVAARPIETGAQACRLAGYLGSEFRSAVRVQFR